MGQGRPLYVFEMNGGVRPGKDNAVGDGHPGIDVKAAGSSAAVSDAAQPPLPLGTFHMQKASKSGEKEMP